MRESSRMGTLQHNTLLPLCVKKGELDFYFSHEFTHSKHAQKASEMMGRCFASAPSPNASELNKCQAVTGLQHVAEGMAVGSVWGLTRWETAISGCHHHMYVFNYYLSHFMEKLANSGAKMVVISNSSRRASTTIEKLSSLGFNPSLFLGAITSGELTHQYLLRAFKAHGETNKMSFIEHVLDRRDDPWFAGLGSSCIHMTWNDRGAISLEGLGLQVVNNVEEAEFVLAHGTEALGLSSGHALQKTLDELNEILGQCAAKKIPMVVANPDFVTVEARALRVMPGTLAATYEKLGGEVKWMGKPGEIIYNSAMEMAGVEAADCIAVGDSLHHDIKGANIAGIASAFITGGVHATELGLSTFGQTADDSSLHSLVKKYDAYPTYVLPSFTW
ncbi:haloacid dehalogenase-like hydrolase superfamily protein [Striga asiatica]|uniref:Haloacid dehalogenase-like hydrolase superfamily protein n=1 Tax=Striga asiatica TaxID=4170 RepID=A0A5A7P5S2_STRAF|nr:haloacid dehalogenase-like hydrolase superfamily protein [Striga asiatica]